MQQSNHNATFLQGAATARDAATMSPCHTGLLLVWLLMFFVLQSKATAMLGF